MNRSATCPKCGCALGGAAPRGLCARCMLESALAGPGSWLEVAKAERQDHADSVAPVLGRFGRYELLQEIGRGGMGIVYRVRDIQLQREVALKLILSGQFASKEEIARFRHEAEAAARLDHPHLVPLYEVGEEDGRPYFTMKYMEGGSLATRLAPGQPRLVTREAVQMLAKIARAVHHAHQSALLHRDIKPGNILLDRAGEPHVSDFGLAKSMEHAENLTLSGTLLGSPGYMAPEQAASQTDRLTTASDTFSLGALLYHLLTGRPAFDAGTPLATLQLVAKSDPRPPRQLVPELDRDLERVCLKCLEKDPRLRYGSAEALAEELERWLRHEPVQARNSTAVERLQKWVRRNPGTALFTLILAVVLALGVTGIFWQWQRAEELARREGHLRGRAVESEEAARRRLYAADMLLAHQALLEHNLGRARALLETHRTERPDAPTVNEKVPSDAASAGGLEDRRPADLVPGRENDASSHEDLRGWEWHYLNDLCRSDEIRTLGSHSASTVAVRFLPDGTGIVSADRSGLVRLWNPAGGPPLRERRFPGETLTCLEVSPDGRWIACGIDHRVEVLLADSWQTSRVISLDGDVASAAFSADSRELVIGHSKAIVHWDIASGTERLRYAAEITGRYSPGRLVLSPDGDRLAATLAGNRIGRRQVGSGQWLKSLPGHDRSTTDLAWSPDGRWLASCGMDGMVNLWNPASGQRVTNHVSHGVWTTSVAFSPDSRSLASAGADQRWHLWRVDPWEEIGARQGYL